MAFNDTLNSARTAERGGNLAQAKQLYEEAHRQNPRNVEPLHRLGVISTLLSQHDRAESYYREAYKLSPNNAELLADMGYSAFMRNDFQRAEAFLQQSFQLNNRDPRTINNLAIALAWRGKDESSLAMFRLTNTVQDSQQRLLSIQVARAEKNPSRGDSDAPRVIVAAPKAPESAVRTTAYNSTSLTIELPAPPSTNLPAELPALKSEPSVSSEVFQLPMPSSTMVTPAAIIELPPPLPAELPELTAELIELPVPSAEPTNQEIEITISEDLPLPPIPPAEGVLIPAEPRTLAHFPDLQNEADQLAIPQQTESNNTHAAPNLLRTSPPTIWRKTRQTPEDSSSQDSEETFEPLIKQTSVEIDATNFKRPTHGICLVTLAEEMRPAPGLKQYEVEYQTEVYRFASREALEKFRSNPRKYVPAAGGVDVVSVRNDQEVLKGSYNFALRFHHRVYLFSSRENAEEFRSDPYKYASAD